MSQDVEDLQDRAWELIGGLRKVTGTIQRCWPSETPKATCEEVINALKDCCVSYILFEAAFKRHQSELKEHVAKYHLPKPKGYYSHSERLLKWSESNLRAFANSCRKHCECDVDDNLWLFDDWWLSLKIPSGAELIALLKQLKFQLKKSNSSLKSIAEGDSILCYRAELAALRPNDIGSGEKVRSHDPFELHHDRMAKPKVKIRAIAQAWFDQLSPSERKEILAKYTTEYDAVEYFRKKFENLRAARNRKRKSKPK